MKIVISESQLKKIIKEQTSDEWGGALDMKNVGGMVASGDDYSAKNLATAAGSQLKNSITNISPHTVATIAEIAATVLIPPPGGIMIAAAIGAGDSYRYFREGNNKMGGLTLLLSALPYISVANKIPGLNVVASKGMNILTDKIAKGVTTLAPEEGMVMNWVRTNLPTVEKEYESFVKKTADTLAKQGSSQVVSNTAEKGYNVAYDLLSKGVQRNVAKNATNIGSNVLKTQGNAINRGLDNMADQYRSRQLPKSIK
jgi:hypothetical protein